MPNKTAKSFTLIELLIAISVLAILAAITYRVIDVQGVRNRARDSNIFTAVDKMALSIEAHISAYGEAPYGDDILALIQGASSRDGCDSEGGAEDSFCIFSVTGFDLPSNLCGTNSFQGSGSSQCYFYYYRLENVGGRTATDYILLGKSFGQASATLGFLTGVGAVECTAQIANALSSPNLSVCTAVLN
ncbi:prepilin-type N-terminal cleavage/methylation domain-containing protein [Patescibacteria group bacterium]|nr:prepilin-type N-terminal cleavage/methylation domain-containing protein [Patescibacteria group bacterium]